MLMNELIERLEKTTGPDRRLDFDLWATLTRPLGFPALHEPEELRTRWFSYWQHFPAAFPRYTALIDDALTLVPDGWRWRVEDYNINPKPRAELAEVGQVGDYGIGIKCRAQAAGASPALALCIAALKARVALTIPEPTP